MLLVTIANRVESHEISSTRRYRVRAMRMYATIFQHIDLDARQAGGVKASVPAVEIPRLAECDSI
jgi:hypothetical protein